RATFMIRRGAYKYIHYVGYEPELFDLESDPDEIDNLAKNPAYGSRVDEYEGSLRAMVDPEAVDEQAYRDQVALVEKHGGREVVLARGSIQGTPAPGDKAEFVT
ncbi:MAG: sulfatase, partial [Alphaproteobacteria bacterium]|nr:sulfatase [Alphaproteobacteria bacterium]